MVTVRCITYNHEPYIRQCLEGFVMQKTNFRFEAIVHDDASTDGTAAIIKEFADKYPNIIKPIFETENQYSKRDGSLRRIMDVHGCRGDVLASGPCARHHSGGRCGAEYDYVCARGVARRGRAAGHCRRRRASV